MKNMKSWIKAAGIRAIKTVAQTAVATIGTSAVIRRRKLGYGRQRVRPCGYPVPAHVHCGSARSERRRGDRWRVKASANR